MDAKKGSVLLIVEGEESLLQAAKSNMETNGLSLDGFEPIESGEIDSRGFDKERDGLRLNITDVTFCLLFLVATL